MSGEGSASLLEYKLFIFGGLKKKANLSKFRWTNEVDRIQGNLKGNRAALGKAQTIVRQLTADLNSAKKAEADAAQKLDVEITANTAASKAVLEQLNDADAVLKNINRQCDILDVVGGTCPRCLATPVSEILNSYKGIDIYASTGHCQPCDAQVRFASSARSMSPASVVDEADLAFFEEAEEKHVLQIASMEKVQCRALEKRNKKMERRRRMLAEKKKPQCPPPKVQGNKSLKQLFEETKGHTDPLDWTPSPSSFSTPTKMKKKSTGGSPKKKSKIGVADTE